MTHPKSAKSGRELRRQLLTTYDIDTPDVLALVDTAAQALDEALSAEKIWKREGMVTTNQKGQLVQHPAVVISQSARNRLDRVLRGLKFQHGA